MKLTKILEKENLKKISKVSIVLSVGGLTYYLVNKSGITEKMAELQHWNQTFGTEILKDYLVPAGKHIYNATAAFISGGLSYAGLKKVFK